MTEAMTPAEVLVDAFGRVRETVHRVLDGIDPQHLIYRPDPRANTVAWLVWHLLRVQDDHVADAAGRDQVWLAEGWVDRFDLPFDRDATGYGQSAEDVRAVQVDTELLRDYCDAVHRRTVAFVSALGEEDLDQVVDDSWDPPVTLGVRLISIVSDDLQHAGQAAYVRGVAERA
ncbi:MAG: hypothetical protein QOE97_3176 [Pseudonocardiales bacterium]|nr:hypothetical protein [Pseudonocardiales bacterium]